MCRQVAEREVRCPVLSLELMVRAGGGDDRVAVTGSRHAGIDFAGGVGDDRLDAASSRGVLNGGAG